MSRSREIKPLQPMVCSVKKTKAQIAMETEKIKRMQDYTHLNKVFSRLYSLNKAKESDDAFFTWQELAERIGQEGLDYDIVYVQIFDCGLSECGQGGARNIRWETIKRIATKGGYRSDPNRNLI